MAGGSFSDNQIYTNYRRNRRGVFFSSNREAKSVGDPTTKYESMYNLWEKARAVIGGETAAKAYDDYIDNVYFSNLLIPFSPQMTIQQYAFYRSEARASRLMLTVC